MKTKTTTYIMRNIGRKGSIKEVKGQADIMLAIPYVGLLCLRKKFLDFIDNISIRQISMIHTIRFLNKNSISYGFVENEHFVLEFNVNSGKK